MRYFIDSPNLSNIKLIISPFLESFLFLILLCIIFHLFTKILQAQGGSFQLVQKSERLKVVLNPTTWDDHLWGFNNILPRFSSACMIWDKRFYVNLRNYRNILQCYFICHALYYVLVGVWYFVVCMCCNLFGQVHFVRLLVFYFQNFWDVYVSIANSWCAHLFPYLLICWISWR